MKRTELLTILLSCSLLAACGKTPEPTVEPTVEQTVEQTVEPTVEPTVEQTVEPTDEGFEGYEKLNSILAMERLEIGVNESYNLRIMLEEEYQNAWLDIYVDNFDLANLSSFISF